MSRPGSNGALKRRIVASFPLTLKLTDDDGSTAVRTFRLSFDFNAFALIFERTGFSVITGEIWQHINDFTIGIVLWAAMLAHYPEYAGDEGLAVVKSYLDASNFSQVTEAVMDAFIVSLPPEAAAEKTALKNGIFHHENPTNPVVETGRVATGTDQAPSTGSTTGP